jgi:purine nucleosidase
LIRVLEDAMRFYFETHHDRGHGYLAYLHDPLAAAVALDPSLLTSRPAAVSVELADTSTRGRTTADPPHAAGAPGHRQPNAQIGVDVDAEVFFDRFVERVGAFARRLG